jgi:hypothetical protein
MRKRSDRVDVIDTERCLTPNPKIKTTLRNAWRQRQSLSFWHRIGYTTRPTNMDHILPGPYGLYVAVKIKKQVTSSQCPALTL